MGVPQFVLLGLGAQGQSTTGEGGGYCITARDLISQALDTLGVIAAGETPSAEDMAAGLVVLNQMIDDWATQRLTIPSIQRKTWTIVSGTASYTVGDGGDVDMVRPVYINYINFIDTSQTPDLELPLQYLTDDAWDALSVKDLESNYPRTVYYNPTFPLGTLTFWPVPTSSTLQGVIYAPQATTQFVDLSSTVCFRPGYVKALRYNLAMDLAPTFNAKPDPMIVQTAHDALANLKRANIRLSDLPVDQALRPRRPYNIYSDGY